MGFALRPLILIAFVLLGLVLGTYVMLTPGLRPTVVSVYEGPLLQVESRVQDLGKVGMDQKVRTAFLVFNQGGKHLRIFRVEPSCGCTVPSISQQIIAPGDFARITVVLDTSLKSGKIRKKLILYSNDSKRPALPLFLVGEALPAKLEGHKMIQVMPKDRLALFKGECASCHVQKGVGKTGQALFAADCAMCHGQNAQGNLPSGPSLLSGGSEDEDIQALTKTIANGSSHNPQMPPFSAKNGGPLNQSQIDSLAMFLKIKRMAPDAFKDSSEEEPGDEKLLKEALKHPN
jgi:cytochrome c553